MLANRDYDWFVKTDLSEYKGEYVIIQGEKVVLHGRDLTEMLAEFRKKYPKEVPKIARVPDEETLIMRCRI
jgi:hypothetical protein